MKELSDEVMGNMVAYLATHPRALAHLLSSVWEDVSSFNEADFISDLCRHADTCADDFIGHILDHMSKP